MGQPDVFAERAEVERSIQGKTLCDWFAQAAELHGDAPALSDLVDGQWKTLTWSEYRQAALEIAAGYAALGVGPGDAVALMMPNRSEHLLADQGALHAGAVPVTVYATFAPEQIAYVAGHCSARVAVLDGQPELDRWSQVLDRLPELSTVIVLDPAAVPAGERYMSWHDLRELGRDRLLAEPEVVRDRIDGIRPEDPVTLLYTSGTTGNPKGVYESHHAVLFEVTITQRMTKIPELGSSLCYLPLAHIAERVLSLYGPIHTYSHVHFCPDFTQLAGLLGQVRPHGFFGVPRVWEKVMSGIQAVMSANPDEQRRAEVQAAMAAGRAYVDASQYGREMPAAVAEAFAEADANVLAPIRALLGLDRAELFASAAAPLPRDVQEFFAGLGMKILDVWGMTETCGAVTGNTMDAFRLGTVGRAYPGVELRLLDDGEILVRAPVNTRGYLHQPDATAALVDADGWLHTGDVGTIDADGFLSIVDRKKELFITAGGENIAPSMIENLLKEHPLVGQALAFGDLRPYPVALLTLDTEIVPGWAAQRGIEYGSLAELIAHPEAQAEVGRAVEAANERLAQVQKIKRWRLLPVEWTPESEELTPTLKLKRRVIHAKYSDAIDSLYAG
ncbi:MAG: AMP-binding protein [Streptosporangiales bacterium]|nr:AMP-binding protein [Streptosporangiales bacterium]